MLAAAKASAAALENEKSDLKTDAEAATAKIVQLDAEV